MTIVKRSDLNRPMTWDELDGNFEQVDDIVSTAQQAVSTATAQANVATQASNASASYASAAQISAESAGKSVYKVPSQSAMLALNAKQGDTAVRADNKKTYILSQLPATDINNWFLSADIALDSLSLKNGYSYLGSFDSIDDLRSYSLYTNMVADTRVYVKSYYASNGYGGGYFVWKPALTSPDDSGYNITPSDNPVSGRWVRENIVAFAKRTVSPTEFGAKPDDVNFDNSVAINAAISYLNPFLDATYENRPGGDVIFSTGLYYVNDTIYGAPGVRLIGTGGTAGFRFSRVACTCVVAMNSMDVTKVLFDTAPYLIDGSGRYKRTDQTIYGRTESNGYYGTHLENLVFIGLSDTQAAVRIWRVVDPKLINIAVYNCKVGFWFNGSWDISMRDCFSFGPKYAVMYVNQCTTLHISHGYFTGNPSFLFASGTAQWFHRAQDSTNKPNIAYVTTFMYAYNSFDITMTGTTIEGCNRDFALFFCGNVNMFGGYTEHLAPPSSEAGHRVFVQAVCSEFYADKTYFNHDIKDIAVQSGNTIDTTTGDYVLNERSRVQLIDPRVVTKFQNINKDLGYGAYDVVIDCQHPITESLATTLSAQRTYNAQFKNLLDQYTMRTPTVTAQGTTSFTIGVNNIVDGGEYSVRFLARNAASTLQQDIRFNVLVGSTCTVTGYAGRSRTGTTAFPVAGVTFSAGVITITFTGNSGNYSVYRVKCVPVENQMLFTY